MEILISDHAVRELVSGGSVRAVSQWVAMQVCYMLTGGGKARFSGGKTVLFGHKERKTEFSKEH